MHLYFFFNLASIHSQISMKDVGCEGNEAELGDCKFKTPKKTCTHFKDAGVQCNYPMPQFHKV